MWKQDEMAGIIEIRKVLPHRYPMLMLDSVLEYEAGVRAVSKKVFSYNEVFFAGHYPDHPIVPGTILLESLSQTASFAILSEGTRGGELLFAGVNRLRFLKTVSPGDCVVFTAEIIKNRHGFWCVNGEGKMEGQLCISAEMTFVSERTR